MKSDVIVLGSELDSLLSAIGLADRGYSVLLLSSGASGLHHEPAGLHVLGYGEDKGSDAIFDPLAAIDNLNTRHPYKKFSKETLSKAIKWFSDISKDIGCPVTVLEQNRQALTPVGLGTPILGLMRHQATLDACQGKSVAIVEFPGTRDFPTELLRAALQRKGTAVTVIAVPLPGALTENAGIARNFDQLANPETYFIDLKHLLPNGTETVLFPAVLGMRNHLEICGVAEKVLGVPCLEVPTLPSSVPGMRLEQGLRHYIERQAIEVNATFHVKKAVVNNNRIILTDKFNRNYEARAAILATGGVLMGGLEVQSCGNIRETMFGLKTVQQNPLSVTSVDKTLDALHRTGIETNKRLNPTGSDGKVIPNLFVTGQTLAHWNPAQEASTGGVSVVTAWAAVQNVDRFLKGVSNG